MQGPETTEVIIRQDGNGFPFTYRVVYRWTSRTGVSRRAIILARDWCTEQFGECADIGGSWAKQIRDLGYETTWYANGCLFDFKEESQAIAFKLRWHGINERQLYGV
ncbi:MAG: hypothetical protein EOP84_01730 [Verrucomicrobiaceae bacterium]|nr:MAG: hypothetical protein EOP84_01730 [Verrucomicrobiaceae bacterium]